MKNTKNIYVFFSMINKLTVNGLFLYHYRITNIRNYFNIQNIYIKKLHKK